MLFTNCSDTNFFKYGHGSFEVRVDPNIIGSGEVVYCHLTNLLNYSVRIAEFAIQHSPNDDIISIKAANGRSFLNSRQTISDKITGDFLIPAKKKRLSQFLLRCERLRMLYFLFTKKVNLFNKK